MKVSGIVAIQWYLFFSAPKFSCHECCQMSTLSMLNCLHISVQHQNNCSKQHHSIQLIVCSVCWLPWLFHSHDSFQTIESICGWRKMAQKPLEKEPYDQHAKAHPEDLLQIDKAFCSYFEAYFGCSFWVRRRGRSQGHYEYLSASKQGPAFRKGLRFI